MGLTKDWPATVTWFVTDGVSRVATVAKATVLVAQQALPKRLVTRTQKGELVDSGGVVSVGELLPTDTRVSPGKPSNH